MSETTKDRPGLPTDGAVNDALFGLYLHYPGRWWVEQDWTVEVMSESGVVAKCRSWEDAESLVAWRDEYAEYMTAIRAEVEAMEDEDQP